MRVITIKSRAKRFAKIAGEMISLTTVENYLSDLWPDYHHAVVSIPDSKKGEALVLVSEHPGTKREAINTYARQQDISELSVPKTIKIVEKIPLLGTGKTDYVTIQASL